MPCFMVFASVHGVNTPTMNDFKLLMAQQPTMKFLNI